MAKIVAENRLAHDIMFDCLRHVPIRRIFTPYTGVFADCRGHDLCRLRQLPHVNLRNSLRDSMLL